MTSLNKAQKKVIIIGVFVLLLVIISGGFLLFYKPNETTEDIKNTVDFINKHNFQGVKIHCTYIVKNTVLEYDFKLEH